MLKLPKMPSSPLGMILDEVSGCFGAGLYYASLSGSLTIPDICAALECDPENVWVTDKKYTDWCARNLAGVSIHMTPLDFYRLRCGVVHQGKFGHPKQRFERIIFTLPDGRGNIIHDDTIGNAPEPGDGDILGLSLQIFVERIIISAIAWEVANSENHNVQVNMSKLVRLRPNGMRPLVIGMPVIA